MKSNFLSLNAKDISRGAILAFGVSVLSAIVTILDSGQLPEIDQLPAILIRGASAGLVYLLKNLVTNSTDEMFKKEQL